MKTIIIILSILTLASCTKENPRPVKEGWEVTPAINYIDTGAIRNY